MPKATVLTSEALEPALSKSPAAATPPRSVSKAKNTPAAEPSIPMQIHVPRSEAKAIKIAAAQEEKTISAFVLGCFHAYMKTTKHD